MHVSPVSLAAILKAIENGETTPRETIGAAGERIDALDGEIGAFVHRATPAALERAAAAKGPLAGVPIGVKDIYDTADMPTAYGSPVHAGFRPNADAALVAMARSKGAAVMGKTATTEFAFMHPAGTRNPHRPAHTPGGSSSGSAAAVASGMVAGAFGSQTAGSVIRPASFCGVAGFKPSFRLLPTVGMKTFAWTLDTAGLFAKGVADVALLADLLSGRNLKVDGDVDASALRIGLYRSHLDDRLEPSMVRALDRARTLLEASSAGVVEIAEPAELARAHDAQILIQTYEGSLALSHERLAHRAMLSAELAAALDEGAAIAPSAYDDARRIARHARRRAATLFEDFDVLLAPSALGPAPASLASTGAPAMNRLWTLTGNPVVNVPGLVDPEGMPLGLSAIGRFGRDHETLAIADLLERLIARA